MNFVRQIITVTLMNLRNIPQRMGSASVIVMGMAGVVAVLVSILAMANGAENAVSKTGSPGRAIVLNAGAMSELLSNVSRAEATAIQDGPGIARDKNGNALVSAESIVLVEMMQKTGTSSNVTLRGVGPQIYAVRPELRITAGRAFRPGVRELLVGRAAQSIFRDLDIGARTTINGQVWTIVGSFESNGDSHEAELLADNETVISAFRRDSFQSVSVKLASADGFNAFRDALAANPQLAVTAVRESEYYAQQSKPFANTLATVAYLVGGIMAVGAFFGAINSMYSAVSTRTVEIATLRAIGFGPSPIVVSIFIESLLLALAGAAIGATLAALLYGGHTVNTNGGGVAHSQYMFAMAVTGEQVKIGMLWACFIGIAGALFPSIKAARLPIVSALRGA